MIEIDATNKSLGRVAQEAAFHLMDKSLPTYEPNKAGTQSVTIVNAGSTKFSPKMLKEKKYARYSGYPGGLRFDTLEKILATKGVGEVYMRAVKRMLPSNKLRDLRLKRLTITK